MTGAWTITGAPPRIERPLGRDMVELIPQRIVALEKVGDRVFLATEHRVYEFVDEMWRPMTFAIEYSVPVEVDPE